MPLSDEARAWAIEAVLSSYQNRWVERLACDALTEDDAVRILRSEIHCGYSHPNGREYLCHYNGIDVKYPDGSSGTLSWREVVRHARAEARQLALPM